MTTMYSKSTSASAAIPMTARPINWSITPREAFWVSHQAYLLQHGYKLRPRYDPNWVPSWETNPKLNPVNCPDSMSMRPGNLLDAIRVSDGVKVALKLVRTDRDVPILEYLNTPTLLADPRNHTVPIIETIPVPDKEDVVWIVMPLLLVFHTNNHPFQYVNQVIEPIKQFLEGMEFMHEHRIAHRDACTFNLMVESAKLVPNGDFCFFRPYNKEDWSSFVTPADRRSVGPLKYYFIDFETARQYSSDEEPLCIGIFGQERNVPGMSEEVPYNPFKLDIYQVGKAFEALLEKYDRVEFLTPLYEAMTCADPDKRPTAAEARQLFETIMSSLTEADMSRQVERRYISLMPGRKPPKPYVPLSARLSSLFRLKNFTFLKLKLIH